MTRFLFHINVDLFWGLVLVMEFGEGDASTQNSYDARFFSVMVSVGAAAAVATHWGRHTGCDA